MKVNPTTITDVKVITPEFFEDDRGFFYESFNQKKFNEAIGLKIIFVQDNESKSKKVY
jgi:dTDP-4-dehydrorhamnose 3,5-epimerase